MQRVKISTDPEHRINLFHQPHTRVSAFLNSDDRKKFQLQVLKNVNVLVCRFQEHTNEGTKDSAPQASSVFLLRILCLYFKCITATPPLFAAKTRPTRALPHSAFYKTIFKPQASSFTGPLPHAQNHVHFVSHHGPLSTRVLPGGFSIFHSADALLRRRRPWSVT